MKIPIFLISLKQDVERREKLKECFPKTYADFQYVEAVDGRALSAKEYFEKTKVFYRYHKRIMSPAELGCALSHIKALSNFLNTPASHALIIEDDIIGRDDDFSSIQRFVKSTLNDGIVYCGCQNGLLSRYKYGKPTGTGGLKVAYSNRGEFSRTAAYVVSRNAAEIILRFHEIKFITVADFWFDLLSDFSGDVYYFPGLSHSLDLTDSNLEEDRLVFSRNYMQKFFSKDVLLLLLVRAVKELRRYWYKTHGHVQVEPHR